MPEYRYQASRRASSSYSTWTGRRSMWRRYLLLRTARTDRACLRSADGIPGLSCPNWESSLWEEAPSARRRRPPTHRYGLPRQMTAGALPRRRTEEGLTAIFCPVNQIRRNTTCLSRAERTEATVPITKECLSIPRRKTAPPPQRPHRRTIISLPAGMMILLAFPNPCLLNG